MKRLSRAISGGDGLWGVRPQREDKEGDGIRQQRGHTLRIVVAFLLGALLATPGLADPWTFIVTGDSRGSGAADPVNTTILGELAAEMVDQDPDLVLFPGDLVHGYVDQAALEIELTTWRDTMQPVYDAGIGVYPIRGNHDEGGGSWPRTAAWNNVFSGAYALPQNGPVHGPYDERNLTYSVEHQNALFLGLDEYFQPHAVYQPWVDEQLAGNTQPHVFAFGHEPAFRVGTTSYLGYGGTLKRDTFWKSLQDGGARAYFCGHDHWFNQASTDDDGDPSNDVHQFVVGTAGAPIYGWDGLYNGDNTDWTVEEVHHAEQYGYLLGEIDGLDASFTWMERTTPGVYEATHTWGYTAIPEPPMLYMVTAGALFVCVWTFLRRRAIPGTQC